MKQQIKNRINGTVIFECDVDSLKIAIELAIKSNANLRNANLRNADLRNADLRNANLYNANLYNADLYNADLYNADLYNADLRNADLRNANLYNANLRNADLRNADLYNADLRNVNLYNANLRNADLRNVKTPPINDHFFISEILFRAAKTENQKNFACRIRVELNLCWRKFFLLAKKMKVVKWASQTLGKWPELIHKINHIKKEI